MKIDQEVITKIAHLARLNIAEEEREDLLTDLNKILSFMDKLGELNTEGVPPLIYMTDEVNVFREDEVKMELSVQQALQNAPKHDDKYFRVAKVITKNT
jgi:aspartyl-tRNA(Asn)/glutamyl-tRNA(Gln) amidotransferase subunit C